MNALLRSYGLILTIVFFVIVAFWAIMLIILPQFIMFERALIAPKRALDSSIALTLARDARTCIAVLKTYQRVPQNKAQDGIVLPSPSTMARTSASNGLSSTHPLILQCERSKTHTQMVRGIDEEKTWLDVDFGLPTLTVLASEPIVLQIETANKIAKLADELAIQLKQKEASAYPYTSNNFYALLVARRIPLSKAQKAIEEKQLSNKLLRIIGLRFEKDGQIYERIGLVTLTRTIFFAMMATALALLLCYPLAYKVALATTPERVTWLFLGLVIPYAIVELMRIYAWTTIIDTQGLLNEFLIWTRTIDHPIQFKRSPVTIFVVIVYTYMLFMVFPIYNVMSTLDRNQIEAARDLGAPFWRIHTRIIIPHTKPGIAVGTIATFMLAAGAFSVPRIISRGLQAEWFSQTIYNKFFESENSNIGAAYSFSYTLICFLIVGLFMWAMRARLKDFVRVQ